MITVNLTNSGTTSVGLSNPDILSDKVHIMNQDVWNTVSYIGPGSSITYSFSIKADPRRDHVCPVQHWDKGCREYSTSVSCVYFIISR
jgi:archaellum component FlaF (FlaF/FlaG flagellin family)